MRAPGICNGESIMGKHHSITQLYVGYMEILHGLWALARMHPRLVCIKIRHWILTAQTPLA